MSVAGNPNQKIYFVTGKGGVGKSTVAAAVATRLASEGEKVLLVELGEQSYFGNVTGLQVGFEPRSYMPGGFDVALWDSKGSLRQFLLFYVKVARLVDLFFENKIMKTFIKAAPALKELAILGKITSGIRGIGPKLPYDSIVVDSFATGHLLALINVPRGMYEAVNFGPMGEQSRHIDQVLRNPKNTKFIITTLAEELPVTEALELYETLKRDFSQKSRIVCNRMIAPPLEKPDLKELHKMVPANEFITYLLEVGAKQEASMQNLLESPAKVSQLPFCLDSDGKARIELLSKEIGWDLKS